MKLNFFNNLFDNMRLSQMYAKKNALTNDSLESLLQHVQNSNSEVSTLHLARQLLDRYIQQTITEKESFFYTLLTDYAANPSAVKDAIDRYQALPNHETLYQIFVHSEPLRQSLLRKLNMPALATYDLVKMRADLLKLLKNHPELATVNADFIHLFQSWFNRGFLILSPINWHTPATILEKIIQYEAVHEIKDWQDLRNRLLPKNRRCFGFFHPALVDEPLIFVEVALGQDIPNNINHILNQTAEHFAKESEPPYSTATFYSISNCQAGLRGISFGNFLIKQVVQELQQTLPELKRYVTLSPIPNFVDWLYSDSANDYLLTQSNFLRLQKLAQKIKQHPLENANTLAQIGIYNESDKHLLKQLAALYLCQVKRQRSAFDSVAHFHLGNGAYLHEIHLDANPSTRGFKESFGMMVNYLYDLKMIEKNHEKYAKKGEINYSKPIAELLKKQARTNQ